MQFRVLTLFFFHVGPLSLSALQIFKEGSTETPQIFKTDKTKQPGLVSYSYQLTDKKEQNKLKTLHSLQIEKGLMELYKPQSEGKSIKIGDVTSESGFDKNKDHIKMYQQEKLPFYRYKQQSDEKLLQIEDQTSGSILDESEEPPEKFPKQHPLQKLSSMVDPAKFLKFCQQLPGTKPSQIKDVVPESGFDESQDNAKKDQTQKLLQKITSMDDPAKFAIYQNQHTFDLKAFINKKFNPKSSASDVSQFHKMKESVPETFNPDDDADGSQKPDKAFLLKWAKESSKLPTEPSVKTHSLVGDALNYYKIISTYKVSGGLDLTKELSPFQLQASESNPIPYGFQETAYPSVIKVVKIVKNQGGYPSQGQPSNGIQPIPQFNSFYQQDGGPQIVPKVNLFKPIHYTNTLGLKLVSHSSAGYVKPVNVTVKKIIKPLIPY